MKFQTRNVFFMATLMAVLFMSAANAQERRVLGPDSTYTPPATATAMLNIPRFDVKDISGRIVRGKDMEGWIILYGFGTEDTADQSMEALKSLAKSAPTAKGVLFICIADTTTHNTPALRPFVRKLLKKEYKKQLGILAEKYRSWGVEPPMPLEDMYYLIADMKGDLFNMFGIADKKDKPHLFIMDGNYKMRGHYTEFNDEVAGVYKSVLAEREAREHVALKSSRKKNKTWLKYAIGVGCGVGLYLALDN